MPTMTGGQALVQQLKVEGIDTIFCLPGVQLDWAFDAIYAHGPGPRQPRARASAALLGAHTGHNPRSQRRRSSAHSV
jgi:thiamine pyrophosphate-dependent acetolactate synthase large subunit-like protein